MKKFISKEYYKHFEIQKRGSDGKKLNQRIN